MIEYNTQRGPLRIPEVGRNLQVLVEYITTLENKEDRNEAARAIIGLLAQQTPQLRNQPEYQQKLWDHLFILSDYKLDIDSDYEMPEKPDLDKPIKKRLVDYHKTEHKYHFYGENVERLISRVPELEDEDLKQKAIMAIAQYMKISYKTWNDDKVSNEVIIAHLKELSKGAIIIDHIPDLPKSMERSFQRENNTRERDNSRKNRKGQNKRQYRG